MRACIKLAAIYPEAILWADIEELRFGRSLVLQVVETIKELEKLVTLNVDVYPLFEKEEDCLQYEKWYSESKRDSISRILNYYREIDSESS